MEEEKKEVEKTPIEEKLDKLEEKGIIGKEGEPQKEVEEKPLTPEQEEALAKHEAEKQAKQKEELKTKQTAYKLLQQGSYFMKFIYDDVERQKKTNLNRDQRRRFAKELRKGIFSRELIEVYSGKIDVALQWIDQNVNNFEQYSKKIATHYKTNGLDKGELLKPLLEDLFKTEFKLDSDVDEPIDGEKFYSDLKEKEDSGETIE